MTEDTPIEDLWSDRTNKGYLIAEALKDENGNVIQCKENYDILVWLEERQIRNVQMPEYLFSYCGIAIVILILILQV